LGGLPSPFRLGINCHTVHCSSSLSRLAPSRPLTLSASSLLASVPPALPRAADRATSSLFGRFAAWPAAAIPVVQMRAHHVDLLIQHAQQLLPTLNVLVKLHKLAGNPRG